MARFQMIYASADYTESKNPQDPVQQLFYGQSYAVLAPDPTESPNTAQELQLR